MKEEELRGLKQSYYTVTQQMFDLESSEERKQAMHAQTGLVEKLQKEVYSAQVSRLTFSSWSYLGFCFLFMLQEWLSGWIISSLLAIPY